MDRKFIDQVQRHTAELACSVMNTVTHMGWRVLPASGGSGQSDLGGLVVNPTPESWQQTRTQPHNKRLQRTVRVRARR